MVLKQCNNGHFYDVEQHPCCPICGAPHRMDQMHGAPSSLPAASSEEFISFIYTAQSNSHAGFWQRVVARIIDSVILSLGALFFFIIFASWADEVGEEARLSSFLFMVVVFLVVWWLYDSLMESSSYQGTLGKLAVRIKVTDMEGRRISFGRATGRFFAGIISRSTLGIGYMMVAWTEHKQALHDIITGCLVENK